MKKIFLLLLFFCNSFYSQSTTIFQTHNNSFDYYKSKPNVLNVLKDENGYNIFNSSGTDSLIFYGEGGHFGTSVSSAGDVNGDSYSDIIVGAPGDRGIYLYFGGDTMDNIVDLKIRGETWDERFGVAVSTAGDVNGDGFSDIIIGKEGLSSITGSAYIYFGGVNIDSISDLTLNSELNNSYFGTAVSTAGDVNGDGYSDVIVGAFRYINNTGRAYIFYGGENMDNIADVILTGDIPESFFGCSVKTAGDINGDGFSDVLVGAWGYSGYKGRAYVFYGSSSMDSIADVVMTGVAVNDAFGISVSTAGDLNKDGYSDVIIGSSGYNGYVGRAYVYLGGVIMNNIEDIIYSGFGKNFGISVSVVGDINGDGFSDVIVGEEGNNIDTGKAYIFFGGLAMLNIPDIIFNGETQNSFYGYSVSTAGDVNGDGYSDALVGAPGFESIYGRGRAYLYINKLIRPQLINPLNKSINNPLLINFKWRNFDSTIYYILSVSSDSLFNNILVKDTIYEDTSKSITGFQKGTRYFWSVQAKNTSGLIVNSLISSFTTIPPIKINIKVLMEGMYSTAFNQLTRKDSVKVYLRNSSPPYVIMDSAKGTIDTISHSGLFNFINSSSGTYYLVVKHLNCLETWSKSGGEPLVNDYLIKNYDFTNSNSQAYGNNMKLIGSKYCIYSGDVNQDGFIDLFDVVPIYNDSKNFITGRYLVTDLNGDNVVDLADMTICSNNSKGFIRVRRP